MSVWLLAQAEAPIDAAPKQPSERQVEAARQVLTEVLSGVPTAAEKEAALYLLMVFGIAVLALVAFVAWRVFAYLKQKDAAEAEARLRREQADAAERQARSTEITALNGHVQHLADTFHSAQSKVISDCNAHSIATLRELTTGIGQLREGQTELKGFMSDLRSITHDQRQIQNENKLLIESLVLDDRRRPNFEQHIHTTTKDNSEDDPPAATGLTRQ